jgi:hypothetical protein
MIVVIVMVFCMVMVAVGAYLFLNRPQEGDECEGKVENGTYVIDDKGKCVLDSCASGYYKSGKECLVDQSGEECEPEGIKVPNGIYLTNQMGDCEMTCTGSYVVLDDECVVGSYVNADTVKFTRTNGPLMIAEVMIYGENGKLISHEPDVTVTSGPTHPGWGGIERLTDKITSVPFHSQNDLQDTYAEFKFSTTKRIERIQVVPRVDARTSEIDDVSIEVLDGTTSVVTAEIPAWTEGSSYLIEYVPKTNTFTTTSVTKETASVFENLIN